MKKIHNFIVKNKRVIFIFFFALLIYEFIAFTNNNDDPIAHYCFSHAITLGLLPYKDFNIITPPLYALYSSLGLFIFDNYFTFIIEQAFLVSLLFYFLFKLFDKKAWLILLGMIIFKFYAFLPTYNFFCFLWIVILYYLEQKQQTNDYLIGLIASLALLSKQTVGLFLIIPLLLIPLPNQKRILKRLIGLLIPCFIFGIYLLLTKTFSSFINLCFLGLFDFNNKNSNTHGFFFILTIITLLGTLFVILKHPKDKHNWYLLFSFLFCFPLFDINHYSLFFTSFIILLMPYLNIKNINYISKLALLIIFLFCILWFGCINSLQATFFTKFNHFNLMYNLKSDYKHDQKVNKFLDSYTSKNRIILSNYAMFYDIINDNKITYYDALLYGNLGYNGTNNIINSLKSKHNLYILVDFNTYKDSSKETQYNKEVITYVIDHYKQVDEKYNFKVYYKE